MYPSPITRQELESVFAPDELVSYRGDLSDGTVTDADARVVLRDLGVPVCDNPWFDMDPEIAENLTPIGPYEFEDPDEEDEAEGGEGGSNADYLPPGGEEWIALGVIRYDDLALDPRDGTVRCLPEDGDIYVLSSSLRQFVHFLFLLQRERPYFDVTLHDEDVIVLPPGLTRAAVRERVAAGMRAVDPEAMRNPDSHWHGILDYIVGDQY